VQVSRRGKDYGTESLATHRDGVMLSQYNYSIKTTPWHYHENPYFMMVLHGNMLDFNRKGKSLLPPGSVMFNNWDERHYGLRHSAEAAGFHLEIERGWFEKYGIDVNVLSGSRKLLDPGIQLLISKIYFEFLVADPFSGVSVDSLLVQIFDNDQVESWKPSKAPAWIEDVKEMLHFDNANTSLKDLSAAVGVHPVHISRAASKHLGVSLGEYKRRVKLSRALGLLLASNVALGDFAYQCGFSDQSNFNHVFKCYFKVSPGKFRQRVKRKIRC